MSDIKRQRILNLMKLRKIPQDIENALPLLMATMKRKYSELSDEQIDNLVDLFGADFYLGKAIDLFEEHFEEEEIQLIERFYASSVGRKLVDSEFMKSETSLVLEWTKDIETYIVDNILK